MPDSPGYGEKGVATMLADRPELLARDRELQPIQAIFLATRGPHYWDDPRRWEEAEAAALAAAKVVFAKYHK
jgi:hypothetical protein